jgi:hypothetical protein
MLTSILGARLRWHLADGWVFDPVIVGPDIIEYTLKEGPHAGRHAIQRTYYQRVAPGIETTAWYEESGAVLHITWYLEAQTSHRFAALPAWLAKDMTVYRGDKQDPAFVEKIRKLSSQQQDWPGTSSPMRATSWCSDRPYQSRRLGTLISDLYDDIFPLPDPFSQAPLHLVV